MLFILTAKLHVLLKGISVVRAMWHVWFSQRTSHTSKYRLLSRSQNKQTFQNTPHSICTTVQDTLLEHSVYKRNEARPIIVYGGGGGGGGYAAIDQGVPYQTSTACRCENLLVGGGGGGVFTRRSVL